MATRKRALGTDSRGRYKIDLGRKVTDSGRIGPHRFLLGLKLDEAERRACLLRQMWDTIESENGPNAQWQPLVLYVACEVAKGVERIEIPPSQIDPDGSLPIDADALRVNWLIRLFPFLPIIPPESEGTRKNADWVATHDFESIKIKAGFLTKDDAERTASGSLHQALDDYAAAIQKEGVRLESGELKPSQVTRLERVARFKTSHSDIPLSRLGKDACADMAAFWRNRPVTARGTRYSRDSVRHHLSELFRFFRWLDHSEKYGWVAPRGLASISRKVPKFDNERSRSSAGKPIFTVEQLACLNKNATPLERLCLYLALNCAMGAAELGRIRLSNIHKQQHPYADKLRFASSPSDTFIRFDRPKTEVFGEWRLWEPVAIHVEWAIQRAQNVGSELLFCYETGSPIYAEGRSKNAQQGFANIWRRLVDRVRRSDPNFPFLPFGTLRDTLPDTMRHEFDGELASLLLCHGSPVASDTLLECYTGKPFGRLHEALNDLFPICKSVFGTVEQPIDERKRFFTAEQVEGWKSQRSNGVPVAAIASEAGVSEMTIYRHLDRPSA